MVASPYGGVNIEEVAKTSPSYIYKDAVDITTGGLVDIQDGVCVYAYGCLKEGETKLIWVAQVS